MLQEIPITSSAQAFGIYRKLAFAHPCPSTKAHRVPDIVRKVIDRGPSSEQSLETDIATALHVRHHQGMQRLSKMHVMRRRKGNGDKSVPSSCDRTGIRATSYGHWADPLGRAVPQLSRHHRVLHASHNLLVATRARLPPYFRSACSKCPSSPWNHCTLLSAYRSNLAHTSSPQITALA